MDLTKQPPRRPSNTGMAGIVGLARMADKARAHNDKTLGSYLYGNDSGLDMEVLAFITMTADAFAEAAGEMDDEALSALALQRAQKSSEEISVFNKEHLKREPEDELHRQLLRERIAKYAPGRTDIKTVFQSIELDDWGTFREQDLTRRPPRTPYLRSVFGMVGLARLADKARAARTGLLGEYGYGPGPTGEQRWLDESILTFLDIGADDFAGAAYHHPNDHELSEWVRAHTERSAAEISFFNAMATNLGRFGEPHTYLMEARADLCPERTDLRTIFDLIDYEDERRFGLVDLARHAPRTPYDISVGGLAGLARMIDKGRAYNSDTLGEYKYGQDCGLDRRVLEFLGVSHDEFAAALKEHATDEAMAEWLGAQLRKPREEIETFNRGHWHLAPTDKEQKAFLRRVVAKNDPIRTDITCFPAMIVLDDHITFARLKAGI